MPTEEKRVSDQIVLYHDRYSYYSQKVLLALYEKDLPFVSKSVDMTNGAQYKPCFLNLSPKGEVPALVYQDQAISGSVKIIDRLERIGANREGVQSLLHKDYAVCATIEHFRRLVDLVPVGAVTMASFLHNDYIQDAKPPFAENVRDILLNASRNSSAALRERASKGPEDRCSALLLHKAETQERMKEKLGTPERFEFLLKQVDVVLQQIENQLAVNKDINQWLCCNSFTLADVSLAILLYRLDALGLGHRFWSSSNLKPNLLSYYQRVQKRDGFKKTVPDIKYHLLTVAYNSPTYVLAGFGVSATALAVLTGVSVYKSMH